MLNIKFVIKCVRIIEIVEERNIFKKNVMCIVVKWVKIVIFIDVENKDELLRFVIK